MPDAAAQTTVKSLRARGWTLATAESCTAGMISWAVTQVAGASAVFDRGFVTYSNSAKTQMLGVPAALIDTHGAVCEQVARDMATGALDRSDADISVSVTGIAGPGGSEFKPEGRVCFGIAIRRGQTHVETVDFGPLGRAIVRERTTVHALDLVARACEHNLPFK